MPEIGLVKSRAIVVVREVRRSRGEIYIGEKEVCPEMYSGILGE